MLRIILGVYSRAENIKIIHPKIQPKKKIHYSLVLLLWEQERVVRVQKRSDMRGTILIFIISIIALLNEVKSHK